VICPSPVKPGKQLTAAPRSVADDRKLRRSLIRATRAGAQGPRRPCAVVIVSTAVESRHHTTDTAAVISSNITRSHRKRRFAVFSKTPRVPLSLPRSVTRIARVAGSIDCLSHHFEGASRRRFARFSRHVTHRFNSLFRHRALAVGLLSLRPLFAPRQTTPPRVRYRIPSSRCTRRWH